MFLARLKAVLGIVLGSIGLIVVVAGLRADAPQADEELKALAEFQRLYGLADGEVLKRVAPPSPKCREVFFRHNNPELAKVLGQDTAVYLPFRGMVVAEAGCSGSGSALSRLPQMLELNIYPQDMEGPEDLLNTRITGDFVYHQGATVEQIVEGLQVILQKECRLPIRLTLRTVERRVFVASGKFHFNPVPGRPPDRQRIEIYAKSLGGSGGGGGGTFDTFLQWVGMFINRRVIAGNIENPPAGQVAWNYNVRYKTKFGKAEKEEPGERDPELVLKNLTAQTGLVFTEEARPVRVLFVEKSEKDPPQTGPETEKRADDPAEMKLELKKGDSVLFFGDSLTELAGREEPKQHVTKGYVRIVRETLAGTHKEKEIKVDWVATGGHKVTDMLKRVDRDVIARKPTIVFIQIGVNDAGAGVTPEMFKAQLEELIGRLRTGGARVVLCSLTSLGEKHDGSNRIDKKLDDLAGVARTVAREQKIPLNDLRKAFVEHWKKHNPENKPSGILTYDGNHFNDAGHRFVAEKMLKKLK